MTDRKAIGERCRQTNRRVWKLRIIQHLTRRGECWETMATMAKTLRIGRRRLTKYLEELRAAGKIETFYRNRTTNIHRVRAGKGIRFPSKIDDSKFTPKQANALTALFRYNEISMKDIGAQTLSSPATARRAVWKAHRLGLLRITIQKGFCHFFSWTWKVAKVLGKSTRKAFHQPLSRYSRV